MIYQLFTMELVHNVTLAHVKPSLDDTTGLDLAMKVDKGRGVADKWAEFDVIVRVRPDLYVLGAVQLFKISADVAGMKFGCGGRTWSSQFNRTTVLRSPHHPRLVWDTDPLSDHSAIGFAESMPVIMDIFSAAVAMSETAQRKHIFYPMSTVERMWADRAKKSKVAMEPVVGWHIVLRSDKFTNVTKTDKAVSSGRRVKMIQMIFSATNGPATGCPKPDCSMFKFFPSVVIRKRPDGKPPKRPVPGRDVVMVQRCDVNPPYVKPPPSAPPAEAN
jgi:hypothetical protein